MGVVNGSVLDSATILGVAGSSARTEGRSGWANPVARGFPYNGAPRAAPIRQLAGGALRRRTSRASRRSVSRWRLTLLLLHKARKLSALPQSFSSLTSCSRHALTSRTVLIT